MEASRRAQCKSATSLNRRGRPPASIQVLVRTAGIIVYSGAMDSPKLDLLWKRLEDAKLQLDHCHNYIRDIQRDTVSGAVPAGDGNYAHLHGLKAEEYAIGRYLRAVNDYKAALLSQKSLAEPEKTVNGDAGGITPREREVLVLVASGKSSREIAKELGISFKTVTGSKRS